jgi:radical SAM superfamily enzyme YgiQ (UPF0313 family)
MTTGGLKSYFVRYGQSVAQTEIELVHFKQAHEVAPYLEREWDVVHAQRARQALLRGLAPVVGFSVYTWNAAEFLAAIQHIKRSCPGITIIVGGPHVQRADDFLHGDGIDVVVLGEGEATFCEWLDCSSRAQWANVAGLAFVGDAEQVVKTEERPRRKELDVLPSALEVVPLRDSEGKRLYKSVAYETSRGCPFKCSFCEWGTGAIGTKIYQFGLERIRNDFERLIEGGIEDLWMCDSNFGALTEDLEKAKMAVDLRKRTGRPYTFQTSWSKTHNQRVQEIVRMLHENGLLFHYNLALQSLTPLALKLSNRRNMRSNQYEPIAKQMSEQGVPIATELIWGLPGDNLTDFETNLDKLSSVFPNINIFGYTLLPGTEFFARRDEYKIETIPVAGYGKAKGEYVIGCHTFDRNEGTEGYFLITGHIMLVRGYVMPLTARLLALSGGVPVSPLLRAVLRAIARAFAHLVPGLDAEDRMAVYEQRSELYLAALHNFEQAFAIVQQTVLAWVDEHNVSPELRAQVQATLALDEAFCPRVGKARSIARTFDFDAALVEHHLMRMELPPPSAFVRGRMVELEINHPACVGEVLKDPDGGSWMKGNIKAPSVESAA